MPKFEVIVRKDGVEGTLYVTADNQFEADKIAESFVRPALSDGAKRGMQAINELIGNDCTYVASCLHVRSRLDAANTRREEARAKIDRYCAEMINSIALIRASEANDPEWTAATLERLEAENA